MKITLDIPESKYAFFMELIKNLGFVSTDNIIVPEWQKEEVRKRIKNSDKNPELLLNWDEIKNDFILE